MSHLRTQSAAASSNHDTAHPHEHPHGLPEMVKEIFAPHSHDAADSVDDTLESSAAGIRAVKISLLVLALTAIAQIVIVVISGQWRWPLTQFTTFPTP